MKTNLTNLFNSSLFRYVQRMAIVCVLLSITISATADSSWQASFTAEAKIATSATAEGKVYVSASACTPSDENWVINKDNSSKTGTSTSEKNTNAKTKTYHY